MAACKCLMIAAMSLRRMVAIEFGMCRSGRKGDPRVGKLSGTASCGSSVAQRGPEGESSPSRRRGIRRLRCTAWRDDGSHATRALHNARARPLLEFLIIAFDAPPQLGGVDQIAERDVFGKVESQYLVGASSPSATRSAATLCSISRSARGSMRHEHAHAQTATIAIHWCLPAI